MPGPICPAACRRHRIVELRAVREEDVEPAVVVVVEQRHAAAHRFDQVLVRGRRVRCARSRCRLVGDVGEARPPVRARRMTRPACDATRSSSSTSASDSMRSSCVAHALPELAAADDPLAFLNHDESDSRARREASPSRPMATRPRRCRPSPRRPGRSGGGDRSASSSSSRSSPRRSGGDRRSRTVTRAPIAERFDRVPTHLITSQCVPVAAIVAQQRRRAVEIVDR